MKHTGILAFTLLLGAVSAPAQAAPAPVGGNWLTQDKDAIVRIGPCGDTLCGTISRFLVPPPDGPDQRDIHNPDKELRARKLLGLAVLSSFRPDGKLWRGRIYDPKTGKSYRSVIYKTVSGNLTVKGCIGPFCQSQTWTKSE